MKTRIRSFILAMLLVLSLTVTTMAAGADSDARIALYAEQVSDKVTLGVYLTAKNATNGRVVIEYDSSLVTLVGYETNDAWVTSVNASTEGEVSFAWVGSATPASARLVNLIFQIEIDGVETATFVGEATELYKSGVDVTGTTPITDTETITLNGFNPGSTTPTPPTPPTPPQPPVDTEDKDDEDEKPGFDLDVPELTEERYSAILTQYPDAKGHWAEENIVKAINAGLFNGTGVNTFSPDGVVTRGMFVTLLYRLSGEPAVSGAMPFVDVDADQYYADAVKWAYSNNIVNGLTATEFAPGNEVSREQMVTMLYRYAQYIERDTTNTTKLHGFGDAASVSSWAVEAMSWAVAEGIITGSGGNLNPADKSTRAQIATVLVRFAEL